MASKRRRPNDTLDPEDAAALDEKNVNLMETLRARYANPALSAVDVASGAGADADLDDHVSARIEMLLDGDEEKIRGLSIDLRSYYVTRLFEWVNLNDGPDGFIAWHPALMDLVAPAYRDLGLTAAADAFEKYLASAPAQRLLADPETVLSEEEHGRLYDLWDAVGVHDAERMAFVRAKPATFSI